MVRYNITMEKLGRYKIIGSITIMILFSMVKSENLIESCVFSDVSGFCRNGSGKFLPNESDVPTLFIVECDMTSLIAEDFSGYSSLKTLHLHNTSLPIPSTRLSLLAKLPGLESLEITDVAVTQSHFEELVHVPNLRSLTLHWTNITSINKMMFVHLKNLQILDMRANYISEIEDGAFDYLPELQTINLSFNRIGNNFNPYFITLSNGCYFCNMATAQNEYQQWEACESNAVVDRLWMFSKSGRAVLLEGNALCDSHQNDGSPSADVTAQKWNASAARSGWEFPRSCAAHEERRGFLAAACAPAPSSHNAAPTQTLVRRKRTQLQQTEQMRDKDASSGERSGEHGDRAHGKRRSRGPGWDAPYWAHPPPGWVAPTGASAGAWGPAAWGPPAWVPPNGWVPSNGWVPPNGWMPPNASGQWYPQGWWQAGTPTAVTPDTGREELDMEAAAGVIGGGDAKKKQETDNTSAELVPVLPPKSQVTSRTTVAPPLPKTEPHTKTEEWEKEEEEAEPIPRPQPKPQPPERQTVEVAAAASPAPSQGLLKILMFAAVGAAIVAALAGAAFIIVRMRNANAGGDPQELEAMRGKRMDPEGGYEVEFEEILLRGVDTK